MSGPPPEEDEARAPRLGAGRAPAAGPLERARAIEGPASDAGRHRGSHDADLKAPAGDLDVVFLLDRARPPRSAAGGSRGASGAGKASCFSHALSSSRSLQVSPRAHWSLAISALWKGIRVFSSSISYSPSALSMRLVACSRSASQTISLATIGSYIGETSPPSPTPESTRTPGPVGSR